MALVKKRYTVVLPNKEFFVIEVTVVTRMFKKPEVHLDSMGYPVRFVGEEAKW